MLLTSLFFKYLHMKICYKITRLDWFNIYSWFLVSKTLTVKYYVTSLGIDGAERDGDRDREREIGYTIKTLNDY